uniref:[histone H3]-trimethyl-L-lysine(4) demethylase n=1 Tax=Eptatretus burgeri TaxID=7764 RepID=A0A8C4QEE2_EPTBU
MSACEAFVPPPECPVFTPSREQFADPLGFIASVRPVVERTGICKIRPPAGWQPPFAVDVEKFRFTPRIQRLNELEAQTRVKLNFLDQIARFWELQGSTLKIPIVERKILDLYMLSKVVAEEGGFELICKDRRWSRIASRLGYPPGKGAGSLLRSHYERIIYPYDLFQSGVSLSGTSQPDGYESNSRDKVYKPHSIPLRQAVQPPKTEGYGRRAKRLKQEPDTGDGEGGRGPELRRVQVYGMRSMSQVACKSRGEERHSMRKMDSGQDGKNHRGTCRSSDLEVERYVCRACGRGDEEAQLLLCDGCDDSFHTFCLIPPLHDVPRGDWRCPKCVAEECSKPQETFGFEQATKEYTLPGFGEMADAFKAEYFSMPVHMVPPELVEKEFWRLVSTIEEDVTVEYGADIHSGEFGSGFPVRGTQRRLSSREEEYARSGWNLNNMPVLEQSVLAYINADISGMKVPWLYVGMCFSAFCWHIEDHWSYSINYLHWGEPKTWYGVPSCAAGALESVMKRLAPELFEAQPDLLHQLVTIMNPNLLTAHGVPVVRTDQCAGEFVVTFPRAYHSGFNQGYNFAEAVNFCTADWLPMGRLCVEHYRRLYRYCVFSHDELICKMAAEADGLDLVMARAVREDLEIMSKEEKEQRSIVELRGVVQSEREAFELLADDERQCDTCKTTCFISALTCSCSPNRLVCLTHAQHLCSCLPEKQCLRFRYALDEIPEMLLRLKEREDTCMSWIQQTEAALHPSGPEQKKELGELRALVSEVKEKRIRNPLLQKSLSAAIRDAEKCASLAQQLLSHKPRTRLRSEAKVQTRLSLEELQAFMSQLASLSCIVPQAKQVQDLLDKIERCKSEAQAALEDQNPEPELLERLLDESSSLDVDLPETQSLRLALQQARWLQEVRRALEAPERPTLAEMRALLEGGVAVAPRATVERALAELQQLLTLAERWEEKARVCLQARARQPMALLETMVQEAEVIPAHLPNMLALKEALRKAREWTALVQALQCGPSPPYLSVLERSILRGRPIPVMLEVLPQLENQAAAARAWKDRTARTFLKKNSQCTLLEVLSPRTDVGLPTVGKSRRRRVREAPTERDARRIDGVENEGDNPADLADPASIVASFKESEHIELEAMRRLRALNRAKPHPGAFGTSLPPSDIRYCVCRRAPSGAMLQCHLCYDWFHSACVAQPRTAAQRKAGGSTAGGSGPAFGNKEPRFLCPLCQRSRRPRLETILSLLVALQKLSVRLPEGEALQCLTERAMAWQDRARQALATQELASALAKLSVLSQRLVEHAAREKTKKIIHAELRKAAANPDLRHIQGVRPEAFGRLGVPLQPTRVGGCDEGASDSEEEATRLPLQYLASRKQRAYGGLLLTERSLLCEEEEEVDEDDEVTMEIDEVCAPTRPPMQLLPSFCSEHAYSSASKVIHQGMGMVRKQPRKSPLSSRHLDRAPLRLSEAARCRLMELLLEVDLLEVTLDEEQHLWRILQASRCPPGEPRPPQLLEVAGRESLQVAAKGRCTQPERKRRRKLEKGELAFSAEAGRRRESAKANRTAKRRTQAGTGERRGNGAARGAKRDRKRARQRSGNRKGGATQSGNNVATLVAGGPVVDESEDEYAVCAASGCQRPYGDEVDWVQCDGGCDEWFHQICVGVSAQTAETEDYICCRCASRPKPPAQPAAPPVA